MFPFLKQNVELSKVLLYYSKYPTAFGAWLFRLGILYGIMIEKL